MFGFPMEKENRVRWWGARAIYKGPWDKWAPCDIDIVPDRQGWAGITYQENWGAVSQDKIDEDKKFLDWAGKIGMKWLREKVKEIGLSTSDNQRLAFEEGPYKLIASPNGSYGYLYIGVSEYEVEPPLVDEENRIPHPKEIM